MTAHHREEGAHGAPRAPTTVEYRVQLSSGRRGARRLGKGVVAVEPQADAGNVPRISRLMALAIRMDDLIRAGAVRDYAELARVGHVTRARITQIMNLLLLAPDIQEAILFLPRTIRGRDSVTERQVRAIAGLEAWSDQRREWSRVMVHCPNIGQSMPPLSL